MIQELLAAFLAMSLVCTPADPQGTLMLKAMLTPACPHGTISVEMHEEHLFEKCVRRNEI